jgi:hypothetical protein
LPAANVSGCAGALGEKQPLIIDERKAIQMIGRMSPADAAIDCIQGLDASFRADSQ